MYILKKLNNNKMITNKLDNYLILPKNGRVFNARKSQTLQ